MIFKDLILGYADAEKEFSRIPNYFDVVFYDFNNILDKLVNDWYFLLCGRKGVGKSAYNMKIQSLASESLFTHYLPLNDFEYSTFEKTNVDKNVTGTQKYKMSWDFTLLIEIYKVLYTQAKITEVAAINNSIELLNKLGFPMDLSFKRSITVLSKIRVGANIGIFDAEYEKEFNEKPTSFAERIGLVNEHLLLALNEVFTKNEIVILIDGADDILRYKKNQKEILASLIRSVDYLNEKFSKNNFKVKIILFMREDILFSINDTDINKIKRDSAISISWGDRVDQLKQVIYKRLVFSGINEDEVEKVVLSMFPERVKSKDFWDYLLEFTLYKPRDVIQFFKSCQELFPQNDKLTYAELNQAMKHYSSQYLIEEMKNELAGFVDDELINVLPTVFRKLGDRAFSFPKIFTLINDQYTKKKFEAQDIKYLLYLLFESGYVGHLLNNGRGSSSVQFKYRNQAYQIDYDMQFLIHRGICNGLGIKM